MENSKSTGKKTSSKQRKVVGTKARVVGKPKQVDADGNPGARPGDGTDANGEMACIDGVELGIVASGVRRGARYVGTVAADGSTFEEASNVDLSQRMDEVVTAQRMSGLAPQRGGNPPKSASLGEAQLLAWVTRQSLASLVSGEPGPYDTTDDGVPYRLAGVPHGARPVAAQQAVSLALQGESVDAIWEAVSVVYRACERPIPSREERTVHELVQAGLDLGLARFVERVGPEPGAASPFEDVALAARLRGALARDSRGAGSPIGQGPAVHVVHNLTHESFGDDPLVATLVALVGHRVVAEHLVRHPHLYSFGLAGGRHCETFVRVAGAESSPFPDASGDKKFTFIPLTREPVYRHQLPTANAVVGRMVAGARSLLGDRRVDGVTLDRRRWPDASGGGGAEGDPYRELDIAVFGCGDLLRDGWLERALRGVKLPAGAAPMTDLCLNVLDELGAPIVLPEDRDFDGIGLADVGRLARQRSQLALLLTSGAAKGRPLVAVARSGCVDTIVCDRAAAVAALNALGLAPGEAQAAIH